MRPEASSPTYRDNALWNAFSRVNHPLFGDSRIKFTRGSGCYLWDDAGNRYFDGFSTLWTNLIGHGRDEMADALASQAKKLSFMHLFSGVRHEPAEALSEQLTRKSPFGHKHCFFGLSGSDATETAIKLARSYWRSKGFKKKTHLVGRLSEYHGTSMGALSLMGWDAYQAPYEPLVPNFHRLPPPNCFRCPWGLRRETCGVACSASFEDYFNSINARETVAAIIIEPIITSDGLITPPDGYWAAVQSACQKHEVLIIADEVSTGMGRTGLPYASSHYGLIPDIVYLAKSLTSGYASLSAVLTSREVYETINYGGGFFSHGTTFGGSPLGCMAALKTLEIAERESLTARCSELEAHISRALADQLRDLEVFGNLRGKGTLFEVELVSERNSNKPPRDEVSLAMALYAECLKRGQYLRPLGRFVCIAPPPICSDEDIYTMAAALREAILAVQDEREFW